MKNITRRNFRGYRALVLCATEKDRLVLTQFLMTLGIIPITCVNSNEMKVAQHLDLVFFDEELGRQSNNLLDVVNSVKGPAIALIGSDAPSSVNWLMEHRVYGYLTKPLRKEGILASLIITYQKYTESYEIGKKITRLEQQVRARQVVCTAVIYVTKEIDISVNDTFSLLRSESMNRRISMEDFSAMIVSGEISIAALSEGIAKYHNKKSNC